MLPPKDKSFIISKYLKYCIKSGYIHDLRTITEENTYFRKVVFTGEKEQIVVMDIKPKEDIGEELHKYVEQTIFLVSGTAKVILNGNEYDFKAGQVLSVEPGTKHNVINVGKEPLKICTIYSPPNHPIGTEHKTKKEALKDEEDERFGRSIR